METHAKGRNDNGGPVILLVDDEDSFRTALAKQLSVRGYKTLDVDNGEDAIKVVRHERPEVVVLDQKMPKMDGIQTLREIKKVRPEVQVIMLTGFGSMESARVTGRHDVFYYLEKPCQLEELVRIIEMARQERVYALTRHEIPNVRKDTLWTWLIGAHNHRPGFILLGVLLFAAIALMPTPKNLQMFLGTKKTGELGEKISGYADYRKMKVGEGIPDYYSKKAAVEKTVRGADGKNTKVPLTVEEAIFRAKVMFAVLVVSVLFWSTSAVPIGITSLMVGAVMYFFNVLESGLVASAYAKDSVIFIFGVLAVSAGISKTGLDRRISILLLGKSSSLFRFTFLFAPSIAMAASFLSEHALVAFLTPVLILVYISAIRYAQLTKDRNLMVMMLLLLTYAANVGGPGSPAAGGRNAVMLGILSDYGINVTFGRWVMMGFPFVPVMAIVIGAYFYLWFRHRIQVKGLNVAAEVRREAEKIGKMTPEEYKAAGVLVILVLLWTTLSNQLGMGGPVLLCLCLLNVLGVIRWRDINTIHWDVVALYAAASAMGYGLAITGSALWLADSFISVLPDYLKSGTGLCVSSSLIAGILTNFMSDGATVAAVGPITVPMATLSGTSPLMVGLATAFASSFAHMFIIGTPNNAIVYAMARDPETGEQMVTMKDFLVHGAVVLVLSFLVLWGWVFFGYWKLLPL